MAHRFLPRVRFSWHGQAFTIQKQLADGQVVIEALVTGAVQTLPRHTLEQALFIGDLRFEIHGPQARAQTDDDLTTHYTYVALDDCSPRQQQVARLRLRAIEPLLALIPRERTQERLQARIADIQATFSAEELAALGCTRLSRASLYRWLKRYTDSDYSLRGLIPQTQNCGASGQSRLDKQVEQLMDAYFHEVIGLRTRLTLSAMHDELCLRIRELNAQRPPDHDLPLPSKATVTRRYRDFRRQPQFQPATQRQYRAFSPQYAPLERVEIDHTLTDLVVVDDDDHLPLGRLTLTLCIDVATRYPLGYYLGFDHNSYQAVSECLYHAIQVKQTVAQYGTQQEWLAYGLPHTLVTDNGNEFLGHDLEDACHTLGIQLQRTPLRSPHLKPFIERMFGTCNTGFFHVAPGTTFSNPVERGDYNSQKMACVYLSQIHRAFNLFFVDIYARSYHSGLRATPAHCWQQAVQNGFTPRLPANLDELRILLGRIIYRQIQRGGIEFIYLRYNCPELLHLRLRLAGEKAKIKLHPADMSALYVYDPFNRRYLTVPALDQDYTRNLSLWKHQLIVKQAHQSAQTIDPTQLAQARRQIQALFEEGAQQRRRGRRAHNSHLQLKPPAQPLPPDPQALDLDQQLLENEQRVSAWMQYQPQQHTLQDAWRSQGFGDRDDDLTF